MIQIVFIWCVRDINKDKLLHSFKMVNLRISTRLIFEFFLVKVSHDLYINFLFQFFLMFFIFSDCCNSIYFLCHNCISEQQGEFYFDQGDMICLCNFLYFLDKKLLHIFFFVNIIFENFQINFATWVFYNATVLNKF